MRRFSIQIGGKTEEDVAYALDEIKRLVLDGNKAGFNANEDGDFSFASEGDYDEDIQTQDT